MKKLGHIAAGLLLAMIISPSGFAEETDKDSIVSENQTLMLPDKISRRLLNYTIYTKSSMPVGVKM